MDPIKLYLYNVHVLDLIQFTVLSLLKCLFVNKISTKINFKLRTNPLRQL